MKQIIISKRYGIRALIIGKQIFDPETYNETL